MGKKLLWVFIWLKDGVLVKNKISNIKAQQKTASFYYYAMGHKKRMFTVSILLNKTHFSHLYVFKMKALPLCFFPLLKNGL